MNAASFLAQAATAAAAAAPASSSIAPAPETTGLFAVMQKGGPVMWPILACSVIALGVFVERLVYYRRCQLHVSEFLIGIGSLLRKKDYREALDRCAEGYGPVVRVVRQAIVARALPPAELREVVREIGQLQLPRLEAHLGLLASIGLIAPLLGLLGTVSGMIEAFIEITRAGGGASVSELALGIWSALITTAAGLVVAIPAYLAYNFLLSRMNGIVADVERAGIESVHLLTGVPSAALQPKPDVVP